ncbi:MAG: hypothetical protein AVDCRST_MAG07-3250 [uncultured Frankineae bacterium]|uniref:Uncharacterized protein n=1 Tax=uncultured Frankineae bacterium TaxID=437475 RepID=A0A6J4MC32_9ACTN|nr:MAG: hypothetical protein AVDCRST_MAG07-3250 [uncultured Frankineae bacterium]
MAEGRVVQRPKAEPPGQIQVQLRSRPGRRRRVPRSTCPTT